MVRIPNVVAAANVEKDSVVNSRVTLDASRWKE
jgi:hypothetical protein